MDKMGKYAAKRRFEQQHTTKSGKREAGEDGVRMLREMYGSR